MGAGFVLGRLGGLDEKCRSVGRGEKRGAGKV